MTAFLMNDDLLNTKITLETAQIRWHELQRFFASGHAIAVDNQLDLIQVASSIAQDDAAQLKQWMEQGLVDTVADQQAQQWYEQDVSVWAVVIKPWVLVQAISTSETAL
jgi:hypothetical protein